MKTATKGLLALTLALFTLSLQISGASGLACDFGNKLEDLKKIQVESVNPDSQQIVAELNIRKDLLRISVSCLRGNAETLNEDLAKLKTPTPEVKAFTEWLYRQIEENVSFYGYKETQITNVGLKGAKDLARELADRRTQIDESLESLVLSLLDWTNNQPLFETGAKRFADIKKTLGAFKLPADHEITLLQNKASALFKEASLENQDAWKGLANQELETGRLKTKASLEKLAEAYTVLLEISEVSKKILPL